MKRPVDQEARLASDTAIQLRSLALGRVQNTFTGHYTKARAFFLSLTEAQKRGLSAAMIVRLEKIEHAAPRARLLLHLSQIHGDLSRRVARGFQKKAGAMRSLPQFTGSPSLTSC